MTFPEYPIITPAYNAAPTVAETLNSVLGQTYPHWEQIVVDDGSVDGTADVARPFLGEDSRIRMIRQSQAGVNVSIMVSMLKNVAHQLRTG